MNVIYAEQHDEIIVDPIILSGQDGGVSVRGADDLDIAFEDIETARAWAKTLKKRLKRFEA